MKQTLKESFDFLCHNRYNIGAGYRNYFLHEEREIMKKLLALLLVVIMIMSLAACKSKEQQAADKFLILV